MNNLSNSVPLTGWLSAAPEMRKLKDGKSVAKISLATHHYREMVRASRLRKYIGTS